LGTVGYSDLSVFVDTIADPTVQAYLYKITGVDVSGFETDLDLCAPHKTIHLLVSTNPELNTTQLEWDRYYGFDYLTYIIYRSPTGVGYTPIHYMASSLHSWTDPSPLPDVGYYRIGVEKTYPCIPTGGGKKADSGPYSHAMSNTEDNRLQETGENQEPTGITLDNNTVDENLMVGSLVGRLATTDPDTIDHHVYKLTSGVGGADNQKFTIVGDLLVTAAVTDYETQDIFNVRIQSTDKGDLSFAQPFIIAVNDVDETIPNEAPVGLSISSTSIAENMPAGSMVGRLWTDDPDVADSHTYMLVDGAGDDDNDRFMILGDLLLSGEEFDFESKDSMFIRIRTTDQRDETFDKAFIITISDINEGAGNLAPEDITLSTNTIDENQLSGTLIGMFTSMDPNSGDVHAYQLVDGLGAGNNESFNVIGNFLISRAVFDFEEKDSLFIRIETTDQDGLAFEKTFFIKVGDLADPLPNQAPANVKLSTNTIDENNAPGLIIGLFSAEDPDIGDEHSYHLVEGSGADDNESFVIMGNILVSGQVFDYETRDTMYIRVSCSDQEGLADEEEFIILVKNVYESGVNSAPTDIILSAAVVDENKPPLTIIGRLDTDDPDISDLHTYILVEGDGDDENESFIIVGNVLFSAVMFDYETQTELHVRVRSSDNGSEVLTTEKSFTIIVNDLLEVGVNYLHGGAAGLSIYPNPFSHSTMLEFPNPDKAAFRMYITDLSGKVVYFEDNILTDKLGLNRHDLPAGVYFVELRGDRIYRGKLVIE